MLHAVLSVIACADAATRADRPTPRLSPRQYCYLTVTL